MKDTRPAAEIAAELNDPHTTRTGALAIVTLVKGDRLTELARLLHVVTHGVKVADIRNGIVAATVGNRVTTDAILNSRTDRPDPTPAPTAAATAQYAISSHATLTTRIRQVTAALLAGDPTDPAVIAELAAAAAALAEVAAKLAAPADARAVALAAIRRGKQPSGWTAITDVRTALADLDLDREQQDALLIGMVRDGLVHPIPCGNLKPLTPADRAAALRIGDQDAHAIQAVDAH